MMPVSIRPLVVAAFSCGLAGIASLTAAHGKASEKQATEVAAEEKVQMQAPGMVHIQEIELHGSGCPPGTVSGKISASGDNISLLFSSMQLSYPPGPRIKTVTCTADINLVIPSGYQFSLTSVDYRGYIYLENKMRARLGSRHFFAGQQLPVAPQSDFAGPIDNPYNLSHMFGAPTWSPCGGTMLFTVQSRMFLNAADNPGGTAIFNGATDGTFHQLLRLKWRRC